MSYGLFMDDAKKSEGDYDKEVVGARWESFHDIEKKYRGINDQ